MCVWPAPPLPLLLTPLTPPNPPTPSASPRGAPLLAVLLALHALTPRTLATHPS